MTGIKLTTVVGAATLAMAIGVPAKAVVVAAGDNGWEVSFEGSVSGFYVYQDAGATLGGVGAETLATMGRSRTSDGSSVGSGLLPAFFSFSKRSPEVEATRLAGSGQIGFAPAREKRDVKDYLSSDAVPQATDLREPYFGIGGDFGAFSIRRTSTPLRHQNYLTDLGWQKAAAAGGLGSHIAPGHSAYEHPDPDYDARVSYRTPDIGGLQVEAFMSGLYHESGYQPACGLANCTTDLTAWGGGLQLGLDTGYGSGEVSGSGYTGEALGSTLLVDEDALDPGGVKHDGWLAQAAWTFPTRTRLGFSYGKSEADETSAQRARRLDLEGSYLQEQRAWTVGVYHDVTDWFKLVAEYSKLEQERFDGKEQESDMVGVGWFLSW